MHILRSEKGIVFSGILLAVGAILVILIILGVNLKSLSPNRSLVWSSDFQKGCTLKISKITNDIYYCSTHIYLHDSGDNLVTLARKDKDGYYYLYAISKYTGNLLWKTSLTPDIFSRDDSKDSIEFWNNKIYLFGPSKVTTLDTITGEKMNSVILPFEPESDPIFAGEKLFAVNKDGKLYEIDPETLSSSLKLDLPYWDYYSQEIRIDGDIIYYIADFNHDYYSVKSEYKFIAYDFVNNKIKWVVDNSPDYLERMQIDEKNLYFFDYGRVNALNKENGETVWSIQTKENNPRLNQNPMLIVLSKDKLTATFNNKIYVLDKYSGNTINSFPEDGEVIRNLKIENDTLYILYINLDHAFGGTSSVWIVAQDLDTGKKLAEFKNGIIDSVYSDQIIGDKYLYAICSFKVCAFKKPSSEKN